VQDAAGVVGQAVRHELKDQVGFLRLEGPQKIHEIRGIAFIGHGNRFPPRIDASDYRGSADE